MKMLDQLIPIVALAFALSMISERLSNFLKLYLPALFHFFRTFSDGTGLSRAARGTRAFCRKKLPWIYRFFRAVADVFRFKKSAFVWENLHLKQTDSELETIRERIILLLSLVAGFVVAGLFSGELKEVLEKSPVPPAASPGLPQKELPGFLIVFGFGILLSFGSKFWHDLLDMLLLSKNIKRRWGDVELGAIGSAGELREYLQATDRDMVRLAIQQNEAWLYKDFPNIRMILPGYEFVDGAYQHCVVIYLIDDRTVDIPTQIPLHSSNKLIKVKLVTKLGTIKAQGRPGTHLYTTGSDTKFGSFGCLVHKPEDDNYYILTCAHVVTGRKKEYDENIKDTARLKVDSDTVKVAGFRFDGGYDCAIIGPVNSQRHKNDLVGIGLLAQYRYLRKEDEDNRTTVYIQVERSSSLQKQEGRVIHYSKKESVDVEFDDGTLPFSLLIVVQSTSEQTPISQAGDSGTVLFDEKGNALGLILGADEYFSYALPIQYALGELKVTIPVIN